LLIATSGLVLGPKFAMMEITALPHFGGVLMMVLPPAGFLVLGLLLATKRLYERHAARSADTLAQPAAAQTIGCH